MLKLAVAVSLDRDNERLASHATESAFSGVAVRV